MIHLFFFSYFTVPQNLKNLLFLPKWFSSWLHPLPRLISLWTRPSKIWLLCRSTFTQNIQTTYRLLVSPTSSHSLSFTSSTWAPESPLSSGFQNIQSQRLFNHTHVYWTRTLLRLRLNINPQPKTWRRKGSMVYYGDNTRRNLSSETSVNISQTENKTLCVLQ